MHQSADLQAKFLEYYNQVEAYGLRSERLASDLSNIVHNPRMTSTRRLEIITAWMRAAYLQGARDMAQEDVDLLRGLDQPVAADILWVHSTKILQKAEHEQGN